jgi:hypothetical protein
MYLVHQKKHREGKWEVAWMWLPHFLAADLDLHKYVDQKMTEKFKGEIVEEESELETLVCKMNSTVISLILERYPILGLEGLLHAYVLLDPEQEKVENPTFSEK